MVSRRDRIAFRTNRDGDGEIYSVSPRGLGLKNITNHPVNDFQPDWAPDGERLVFQSDRDGGQGDIYVMNADGSGITNITSHPDNDRLPAWSRDGQWIAFQSYRDRNQDVYITPAAGGPQLRVTRHPSGDGSPSWVAPSAALPVRAASRALMPWARLRQGR